MMLGQVARDGRVAQLGRIVVAVAVAHGHEVLVLRKGTYVDGVVRELDAERITTDRISRVSHALPPSIHLEN